MHLAIPPTPHHALCNLTEGLEVALRKPCCRSFANPYRLQWPMVLSAAKADCNTTNAAPCTLQSDRRARSSFAETLLPFLCQPLSAAVADGTQCCQGSCEFIREKPPRVELGVPAMPGLPWHITR